MPPTFRSLSGPWGHYQPSRPCPASPGVPPPWPRSRTPFQLSPGHLSCLRYRGAQPCLQPQLHLLLMGPPGPGSPLHVPCGAEPLDEVCRVGGRPQPPACPLSWGSPTRGSPKCWAAWMWLYGARVEKAGPSVKHRVSRDAGCLRRLRFIFWVAWQALTFVCSSWRKPVPKSHSQPLRGSHFSPAWSQPQDQLHCSWRY